MTNHRQYVKLNWGEKNGIAFRVEWSDGCFYVCDYLCGVRVSANALYDCYSSTGIVDSFIFIC